MTHTIEELTLTDGQYAHVNALLSTPQTAPGWAARDGEAEFLAEYATSKYGGRTEAHTADAVVFAFNEQDQLHLLCIKRKNHPYKGYWCLPGGFVDTGEDAGDAVLRELAEETHLNVHPDSIIHIDTYATPWRDPRMEHVISDAFMTLTDFSDVEAGDDAAAAEFIPVSHLILNNSFGFDHEKIVYDALTTLSVSQVR